MFKVGQKVVCVNDDPEAFVRGLFFDGLDGLRKGTLYTVRFCGMWGHPIIGEYLGVQVAEISRGLGGPFHHLRFQPLRETSIDVFTQLLVKVPETVE